VQKGKVFGVTPPDGVTLALAEGTKDLVVPTGTNFVVDGNSLKVGQLKPGMMVEATIVTTGADDAASATSVPPMSGVLLVSNPPGDGDLPAAGTNLPLYGVLGLLSLSLGFALLRIRKPVKQS
jgi:LPXTG-motif cell wall-anchored protein